MHLHAGCGGSRLQVCLAGSSRLHAHMRACSLHAAALRLNPPSPHCAAIQLCPCPQTIASEVAAAASEGVQIAIVVGGGK